ncbi:DUF4238 domain-containing protein [Xanthomonas albilineans]|uniref:DUF4238 domain-containing protein n=1 Tax=Xanthomonas albilineans TaxID=29447 RepID=UPI00280AD8CC|nr:DUF4238 domain-containing protein [Xanthomonas albilineans]
MTTVPLKSKPSPGAPQGPSRENHYVPEWYQRGFHVAGADNWFLDISPPRLRPDGAPIFAQPRQRSPKACFWQNDLYVTRFGGYINDQIETVLFQGIDDYGAAAVRAFIGGDIVKVHEHYQPMLAYLGAQKLRTPKGLDWIRSRYPALSQLELMREMQNLRQMFGTLWAECVHEVVSAEDSGVKFLITDHPVTTFNAGLPLDASVLDYPNEAPITWNGTQTLFPLDANHLLILTHVSYAKDPCSVEITARRVNARYFGHTILRTNALIRERRFDTKAVIAVNAWLKTRAHRYIAAGECDWLYPERTTPVDRVTLARLLLPQKTQLWRHGCEIYIGYEDGTFGYRDAYGHTSHEHEFVAKAPPATLPGLADWCPCGARATFGACCANLPPWERPPWNVLSLHERNLGFLSAIGGVLELTEEDSWQKVQRTLSDEQVVRLHRICRLLWPEGTDLAALLPRPGDGGLRAIYMGPSDPRTARESIISLVPLFDQVLVMDPVLASRNLQPEYSPVDSPAQHKQQFLKNILFWLMLEPLIRAGKVLVFPSPSDLNPEFEYAMHTIAMERTAQWRLGPQQLDEFLWLSHDDLKRSRLQLPDRFLLSLIKDAAPDQGDEQHRCTLASMRRRGEKDPMALLQVLEDESTLGQMLVVRCVNLEVALFMAQSTGAVVVTDVHALWDHLHLHACPVHATAPAPTDGPITLTAALDPFDALAVDATEGAMAVRAALKGLLVASGAEPTSGAVTDLVETLRMSCSALGYDVPIEHEEMQVDMHLTPSIPPRGFESPTAQRLVVAFGRERAPLKVGLVLFRHTDGDAPHIDDDEPN